MFLLHVISSRIIQTQAILNVGRNNITSPEYALIHLITKPEHQVVIFAKLNSFLPSHTPYLGRCPEAVVEFSTLYRRFVLSFCFCVCVSRFHELKRCFFRDFGLNVIQNNNNLYFDRQHRKILKSV